MELIDRIKAGVTAFKDTFCAPRYPMGKPKMLDELLKRFDEPKCSKRDRKMARKIASELEKLSKKS